MKEIIKSLILITLGFSAVGSFASVLYTGDTYQLTPDEVFEFDYANLEYVFATSTLVDRVAGRGRFVYGINSATTSPIGFADFFTESSALGFASLGSGNDSASFIDYSTTSPETWHGRKFVNPVSDTFHTANPYTDYWFLIISGSAGGNATTTYAIHYQWNETENVAEIFNPLYADTVTFTYPVHGQTIATSSGSYIDPQVDFFFSASSTNNRVYMRSSSGTCFPDYITVSSVPLYGSQSFMCPISQLSPTILTASIGTALNNTAVYNSITVYSAYQKEVFGISGTTTVAEYALEGCNTAQCSISDISGCFKKALCWAFIPAMNDLPPWQSIGDKIGKKPPFGYISALNSGLQGLNADGSPAFTLMDSATRDDFAPIFDPIRDGLLWILWLACAVWLYNRSKQIQT